MKTTIKILIFFLIAYSNINAQEVDIRNEKISINGIEVFDCKIDVAKGWLSIYDSKTKEELIYIEESTNGTDEIYDDDYIIYKFLKQDVSVEMLGYSFWVDYIKFLLKNKVIDEKGILNDSEIELFKTIYHERITEKQKMTEASNDQQLQTEFNVMSNIKLEKCKKYKDKKKFKRLKNNIYEDLSDSEKNRYRMTISYELESNENNVYPLEDLLNKYYLYVSDFLESENDSKSNTFKLELGGELKDLKEAQAIIGKKVFNREYLDENGQVRVQLIIE
ncbi:hypothetical protein ACFS5M_00255 [Lacinutrix iliipiscaria]|uniref:Uncharacterized protein n=1 Tax=Lacinutrix iliipiscaria TaxID=1230532 RepID=A0ABW5WIL7_9FLAO